MGKQLKLEKGDDQCDPKQAPIVANDLVAKGVVFVAGHFCSGSSIPASGVYAEEGILQITPASTNPKFTEDRSAEATSRSAPAAVTISRAPSPVRGLPSTSRARTSRSSTTSRPTARVSPT